MPPQPTIDSPPQICPLIAFVGKFLERDFNPPLGDAARPQLPRDPVRPLPSIRGAIARELTGITRVVEHPPIFQPSQHQRNQPAVCRAALQQLSHLMHGMSAPRQRAHSRRVEFLLRVEPMRGVASHGKH